jgi:transposase-like protein
MELKYQKTTCKYCNSEHIKKYGFIDNKQMYYCNDCKRKFKNDDSLFGYRMPSKDISSSLMEYYSGMSVNDIRNRINQEQGYMPAQSTVYDWINKYTDKAVEYFNQYKPDVGDTWVADETIIDIEGKDVWLWDIIDEDTRFLLATKLSYSRNTEDAETLFRLAYQRAGKKPKLILTDKLRVYPEAVLNVFGGDSEHKQSSPFVREDSTRRIERFHGTLKERTKVMRGLKDANSALAFTDGFLVYYNFMKPHEGLEGKTPAEQAGIKYEVKNWSNLIRLGEPNQAEYKVIQQYTIPEDVKTARKTVKGKPYRAGRKRGSKTKATKPLITRQSRDYEVQLSTIRPRRIDY